MLKVRAETARQVVETLKARLDRYYQRLGHWSWEGW